MYRMIGLANHILGSFASHIHLKMKLGLSERARCAKLYRDGISFMQKRGC